MGSRWMLSGVRKYAVDALIGKDQKTTKFRQRKHTFNSSLLILTIPIARVRRLWLNYHSHRSPTICCHL